ncbi:hypothetical protein EWM62_06010 [Mucilaginibacter terrigena]|uniref:DUF4625 domain-containing protein n=1 Tax=Mucilaginibacter terrigena TaxID=2492395 RepID=A0A4Q5LQ12_9SPHI|nr:hypothetical protein [Mucilaginibacter terrigena]RYU91492.1 hypothetical protein EWM62_06010 [Mucilaginibacter terrigena]
MRYISFSLAVALIILSGCKSSYLITTQEQLKDSPCQTSDSGVNIRVKNAGKIAFTKIAVKYNNKELMFAGLKPGDSTCYKNLPSLWTNNDVTMFFSKQPGYYMKLMAVAVDRIRETKITHGFVTINVTITKAKGQLNYNTVITVDKK